jgi:hypothetical protein
MEEQAEKESLLAAYKVPGFRAQARVDVCEIKDIRHRLPDGSWMTRECHVHFCERPGL